jgi:hypothetical protein
MKILIYFLLFFTIETPILVLKIYAVKIFFKKNLTFVSSLILYLPVGGINLMHT